MRSVRKKVMSTLLALVMTLSLFTPDLASAAANTTLKTKSVTLQVGKKSTIVLNNAKKTSTYSFTSSNKKVATVSKAGKITAIKAGSANILVKESYKVKAVKKVRTVGTVKVKVIKVVPTQKPTAKPTSKPAATVAPTAAPTTAPTKAPTTAPTNAPATSVGGSKGVPATTTAPVVTAAPTGSVAATPTPKVLDLSTLTSAGSVSATYDAATGKITAKNVESFTVPLGMAVANGETVYVKLTGSYAGTLGFRSWLVEGATTNSNQVKFVTDGSTGTDISPITSGAISVVYALKATADSTGLMIKGPSYGVTIDDLTVSKIEVFRHDPSKTPTVAPTATPAPTVVAIVKADFQDDTLGGLAGTIGTGLAIVSGGYNSTKALEVTTAGVSWGTPGFDLLTYKGKTVTVIAYMKSLDNPGQKIGVTLQQQVNGADATYGGTSLDASTGWTKFVYEMSIPADATRAYLYFEKSYNQTVTKFLMDNVLIFEGNTAAAEAAHAIAFGSTATPTVTVAPTVTVKPTATVAPTTGAAVTVTPTVAPTTGGAIGATSSAITLSANTVYASGVSSVVYQNGGVSFLAKAEYNGGGIAFYINPDKSIVNKGTYSKVKITVSTNSASTPVFAALVTDPGGAYWNRPGDVSLGYKSTSATANQDVVLEFDLTAYNTGSANPGAYAFFFKYNAYKAAGDTTVFPDVNFTIKSIVFEK